MTGSTNGNCFPPGIEHFTEISLDTNQNNNTDGDKTNNADTDKDKVDSPEYNQIISSPNQASSSKGYSEASL